MPRKKDGMKYELLPRPTKGPDGRPLLYPRPALGIKYSMRHIDDFCNKYRGMHQGEMTRALEGFIDVAAILMKDGGRIETPLGSFAPKLRLDGDYTDPNKVKSKNIRYVGIEFIPSKQFIEALGERIDRGFLQVGEPSHTEQLQDPGAMDMALRKSMGRGYTTVKKFAYYSGLKYDTAKRYLNSLCSGDNPLLYKRKEGTTFQYMLTSPEEAEP